MSTLNLLNSSTVSQSRCNWVLQFGSPRPLTTVQPAQHTNPEAYIYELIFQPSFQWLCSEIAAYHCEGGRLGNCRSGWAELRPHIPRSPQPPPEPAPIPRRPNYRILSQHIQSEIERPAPEFNNPKSIWWSTKKPQWRLRKEKGKGWRWRVGYRSRRWPTQVVVAAGSAPATGASIQHRVRNSIVVVSGIQRYLNRFNDTFSRAMWHEGRHGETGGAQSSRSPRPFLLWIQPHPPTRCDLAHRPAAPCSPGRTLLTLTPIEGR